MAGAAARGERVLVLRDTAQAGQSAAAAIGIAYAQAEGFGRVLLVPGDTPLLDPGELAALLAAPRPVSIVPDRHGTGTNALVLSPPDAIAPSFGPGSLERHVAAAVAAGVPSPVEKVPTLMLDVDTGADLAALKAALAQRRGGAPATREALRRLERPQGRPASRPERAARAMQPRAWAPTVTHMAPLRAHTRAGSLASPAWPSSLARSPPSPTSGRATTSPRSSRKPLRRRSRRWRRARARAQGRV